MTLPIARSTGAAAGVPTLRVATYNIHKGVRGVGPARRLEIHNLCRGVAALDADLVCLQEVRLFNHGESRRFARSHLGWPEQGQAEFLAPQGYDSAYRTNARTRDGEHGNALLSRWPLGDVVQHDISDHRFEQRGLLHVPVRWQDRTLHVVVVHFGLIHRSRVRQVERLAHYLSAVVPAGAPLLVAGDFNDWSERLDAPMATAGLARALDHGGERAQRTFPSRLPVFALDRVYVRGLRCVAAQVPRHDSWARLSDHLPLVVELRPT
ncbi:MAG: hypothetical protein RL223_290 [Pseudomonadota bacterium]|jgi:endonuclease/exonuclease/phosphatase family metal-dependent hydrolase